uniref:(northern house mosquito) hypothetical protein n=1 Tax=Culex pipiens TaxID=7175 RepID=A0A8D8BZJ5_CULPI
MYDAVHNVRPPGSCPLCCTSLTTTRLSYVSPTRSLLGAVRWSERGTARTVPAAPATTTMIPHTPGPSGTYQDSTAANFSFPRNVSVSFQHMRDLLTLPLRKPWLLNRLWGYRAACRSRSAIDDPAGRIPEAHCWGIARGGAHSESAGKEQT